jgi:hypothetical protein
MRQILAYLLAVVLITGGMVGIPEVAMAANVNAGFQFGFGTGSIGCTKFNDFIQVNVDGSIDSVFLDQSNFDKNVYIENARFYGEIDNLPREITPENGAMKRILASSFQGLDPNGSFGLVTQYASGFEGQEFARSANPVVTGKYNGYILLKREGRVFAKPNVAVSTSTVTTKLLTFTCGSRDEDNSSSKNTRVQDLPRVILKQVGKVVSTPETIQQLLREIQKQAVKVRVRVR